MSYIPDIPGINIEDVMDPMLSPDVEEAESRLSEEERKVLAEIRAEKELVLEKIKVISCVNSVYGLIFFWSLTPYRIRSHDSFSSEGTSTEHSRH
jgi:hypothetical protein